MTSTSPLKLLAIDDDVRNLEIIRLSLERQGLEILTSNDPEEGFETFLRTRPKIAIWPGSSPALGTLLVPATSPS